MDILLVLDGTPLEIDIAARRPTLLLEINGRPHEVAPRTTGDPRTFSLVVDGVAHEGFVYRSGDRVSVRHAGRTTIFDVPQRDARGGGTTANEIRADMPGVVVAVHCKPGQTVAAGEKLLTVESMKLQAALSVPRAIVVEAIHVEDDQAFDRGATLVSFKDAESV